MGLDKICFSLPIENETEAGVNALQKELETLFMVDKHKELLGNRMVITVEKKKSHMVIFLYLPKDWSWIISPANLGRLIQKSFFEKAAEAA